MLKEFQQKLLERAGEIQQTSVNRDPLRLTVILGFVLTAIVGTGHAPNWLLVVISVLVGLTVLFIGFQICYHRKNPDALRTIKFRKS